MKKKLLVLALIVVFGLGLGLTKGTDLAGDPPVGGSPFSGNTFVTFGDPPVGG